MLKNTLYFGKPYHLSARQQQLVLQNKETGENYNRNLEDTGYLIIDHPQITFTQGVMQLCAENNVAVIICDSKHHPASMMLHLDTHNLQGERFREQVEASEPLRKQLWQQTIKAKIENQAAVITATGGDGSFLNSLKSKVLSGDSSNTEGYAAKVYWKLLFGPDFVREREGAPPNLFLNYGYAIVRASIARALACAGLLPVLGIHHHNRYNSFALADDIMEPFRPWVDYLVWKQKNEMPGLTELEPEVKKNYLQLLTSDCSYKGNLSPLMVAMEQTAYNLAACFGGKQRKLIFPEFKL